jgi:hypothetical protein
MMAIAGGLFADSQDIIPVLEALEKQGFRTFDLIGPEELFTELGEIGAAMGDQLEQQRHTAAGTISGITINPQSYSVEDPTARPVREELTDLGLGVEEADFYVTGLEQYRQLLLVRTSAGRLDDARRIMGEHGAVLFEKSQASA